MRKTVVAQNVLDNRLDFQRSLRDCKSVEPLPMLEQRGNDFNGWIHSESGEWRDVGARPRFLQKDSDNATKFRRLPNPFTESEARVLVAITAPRGRIFDASRLTFGRDNDRGTTLRVVISCSKNMRGGILVGSESSISCLDAGLSHRFATERSTKRATYPRATGAGDHWKRVGVAVDDLLNQGPLTEMKNGSLLNVCFITKLIETWTVIGTRCFSTSGASGFALKVM